MGVGNSREFHQTDIMNQDSQSSHSRRRSRSTSLTSDDEEGPNLRSFVGYLLRSGRVHFKSKDDEESASGSSDEDGLPARAKSVTTCSDPDLKGLQKNDMYSLLMKPTGRMPDSRWMKHWKPNIVNMVTKRELGVNKPQQFTHPDMCFFSSRYLPNHSSPLDSYDSKVFCGIFSRGGDIFVSACQDQQIRIYSTADDDFKLIKCIRAQDVGWSVLDTAFSPDGRFVAYSSWSESVHLCSIYGDSDIHEALRFEPGEHSFCIFSLMFSSDNREILGGANDGYLYAYDRETNKRTLKINAHDDDVNTVRFADSGSQILYSGGDDGLCKVWDRRTLRDKRPVPVGILAGHFDGITYIDSKGDARYFISNSKDQSLKLWDIRHFSDKTGIEETKKAVVSQHWDYRWQQVPKRLNRKRDLKGDSSVMTYKGHCIRNTLIRCKFSPEASTGQRYIYTGCATGGVVVYDVLTGNIESKLAGHSSCVRDVSWHPYKNIIVSSSWDGRLLRWTYRENDAVKLDSKKDIQKGSKVTRLRKYLT